MFKKLKKLKDIKLANKIKPLSDGKGNRGMYLSRTMLKLCKNPNCQNQRRHGSAYCGRDDCGVKKDENKNIQS